MGIVVGLLLGAGLFCVWWSWWSPAPSPAGAAAGAGAAGVDAATGAGGGRLRGLLLRAGLPSVGPWALLSTCAGAGVTTGLVVLAMSRSTVVATGFAVLAASGPLAAVRARARRRRAVLRDLWPEVVDNLASAVRAGLSLPEALAQLGERGPAVLQPAFRAFAADHRTTGRFAEALDALKERLADPVGDRLCEALRITREVGGSDLGRLLRNLSAFLRDDARTRAELEARQSWTVNAARLAAAAPWAVLALLATRPESVRAYESTAGAAVLAIGATATLVAYRLMVRIGRLPEDERVLR